MGEGHKRAVELIQKAFEQKATFLDLGFLGLTEVPDEIVLVAAYLKELNLGRFYFNDNGRIQSQGRLGVNTIKASSLKRLADLTELRMLYLEGAHVGTEGTALIAEHLPKLNKLNLSTCLIGDDGFGAIAKELKNLISLRVENNSISDEGLKSLNVGLPELEKIFLSNNKLTSIGVTHLNGQNLPKLTTLDLSVNHIDNAGVDCIASSLPKLQILILADNPMGDDGVIAIGEHLKDLKFLELSRNHIGDDGVKGLTKLPQLIGLELLDNNISDEGAKVIAEKMPNLTFLNLGKNVLGRLARLTYASPAPPAYHRITDAGVEAIAHNLKKLVSLGLMDNEVSDKGAELILENLSNLNELDLRKNSMKSIPKELIDQANCLHSLRDYFAAISKKGAINDEITLTLVGNSTAGKSSLVEALKDGTFTEGKSSTHGMILERWQPKELQGTNQPLPIKVNIRDFGGQEYYHSTHHLFLQKRAVYTLVWEQRTNLNGKLPTEITFYRKGEEKTETLDLEHFHYRYWLEAVRHYAKESPILMLQNKLDDEGKQRQTIDPDCRQEYDITPNGDFYLSLAHAFEDNHDHADEFRKFRRRLLQVRLFTKLCQGKSSYLLTLMQVYGKDGEI